MSKGSSVFAMLSLGGLVAFITAAFSSTRKEAIVPSKNSPLAPVPGGAYPAAVERWRPFIKKYLPGLLEDFMLRWIKRESAGLAYQAVDRGPKSNPHLYPASKTSGIRSSLDERGVTQMSHGSAKSAGISEDDWQYLLVGEYVPGWSADRHFQICAKDVLSIVKQADAYQKGKGFAFTGVDKMALIKLVHGLPGIIAQGIPAFRKAHGGAAPTSWSEWASWLRESKFTVTAKAAGGPNAGKTLTWPPDRIDAILKNAEITAGIA